MDDKHIVNPLSEDTAKQLNEYNNTAHNQRTDAIIDVLHKIHFWVAIIGLYFLLKIIVGIFSFFALANTGIEFIQILENLF